MAEDEGEEVWTETQTVHSNDMDESEAHEEIENEAKMHEAEAPVVVEEEDDFNDAAMERQLHKAGMFRKAMEEKNRRKAFPPTASLSIPFSLHHTTTVAGVPTKFAMVRRICCFSS